MLEKNAPQISEKIETVFATTEQDFPTNNDPETMLYGGSFFSPRDRQVMQEIISLPWQALQEYEPVFEDNRLPELYFRYKARNFPESLTPDEFEQWEQHKQVKLLKPSGPENRPPIELYFKRLDKLRAEHAEDRSKLLLLDDLQFYAESLIPY